MPKSEGNQAIEWLTSIEAELKELEKSWKELSDQVQKIRAVLQGKKAGDSMKVTQELLDAAGSLETATKAGPKVQNPPGLARCAQPVTVTRRRSSVRHAT